MRKRQYKLAGSIAEINVTPLVDVILVLLIIFMITAPMMQSGIEVALPEAESASNPAEMRAVLTIDKDGYIYFNNKVINQNLLEEYLKAYYKGASKKVIFLKADRSLPYGKVIEVLDIIKRAGIEVVGMVVEPKVKK